MFPSLRKSLYRCASQPPTKIEQREAENKDEHKRATDDAEAKKETTEEADRVGTAAPGAEREFPDEDGVLANI